MFQLKTIVSNKTCHQICNEKKNDKYFEAAQRGKDKADLDSVELKLLFRLRFSSVFLTTGKKVECEAIFESINVIMAKKFNPCPSKET